MIKVKKKVLRICMNLGMKYWAFVFAFSFNFLCPEKLSHLFSVSKHSSFLTSRSKPGDIQRNIEKVPELQEKKRPNGLLRSASADFRSPKSLFKSSSCDLRSPIQKSSSGDLKGSKFRSSSAEPEFLRFWLEKDRAINKVDLRTTTFSKTQLTSHKGIMQQQNYVSFSQ